MGLLSLCLGWICPEEEEEGGHTRGSVGRGGAGSHLRGRDRLSAETTLIIYLFI